MMFFAELIVLDKWNPANQSHIIQFWEFHMDTL